MPRRRGKYYLEDASYLPEMIVTPNSTTYLTDELGNPAISLGALRDTGGNPKIYSNKELSNNQPTYGITNKQASKWADLVAGATAPGIGDLLMAGIGKPMNLTSPSHWWGAVRDWDKEKGWRNIWEDNSGVLTKQYAEQHPWQALGANLLTDALAGKIGGNTLRIGRNIRDRNKFAYKYISPFSYQKPFDRGINLVKHILKDKSFKRGEIPEPILDENLDTYIQRHIKQNGPAVVFRDEAWRKYLGLPQRLGLYVDNGDGTFRYDKKIVDRLSNWGGIYDIPEGDGNFVDTALDYITGNGGHVKLTRQKTQNGYRDTLEDIWDLHPFQRSSSYIEAPVYRYLNEKIAKVADKAYKGLYNAGLYKNNFIYNNLGGEYLNNLRYTVDTSKSKIAQALQKGLEGFEVGKLIKGKPFKMKTVVDINTPTFDMPTDDLFKLISYKYGGKIHIKKKNRGKFNALKKRTGKTTEELTHSKNPLTRKRAIFAQNAAKWKH